MTARQIASKPKTVRVRIAIAVDGSGKWNACGWSADDGTQAMDLAIDGVEPGEARYWVEAELPLPRAPVAKGEVTEAL